MVVLHHHDIDQVLLAQEWHSITGDSWVVDVRPLQNPDHAADDFVEVFKYAVKFGDLSLADNWEAYQVLKGRRLLFSAGLFWGLKVPDEWMDEPLEGLPFFRMMYRHFGKSGYVQTDSQHCEPVISEA
jgi:hypothetical protein